jgi:hypothetical protein
VKINVVPASSFTERGVTLGRLDAEFVDPDMLAKEQRLLDHYAATPLAQFKLATVDTYSKPKAATEAVVSYIAIDDIDGRDGFIFHQRLIEDDLPSRAKYRLKTFDILISNVRPERGAVGLVLDRQDGAIGSSGLTVVRMDDAELRNLMFAFLRTSTARDQLIRRSRGSMYPAITKDDVPEILVPAFAAADRTAASAKVADSIAHRETFFDLHDTQALEVEDFLQSELGDPPPDIVLDVAGKLSIRIASFAELGPTGADRFDAEFHRREFVEFQKRLAARPRTVRLGESFDAFAGGNAGKGSGTVQRLRQAQLTGFGIDFTGCETVEQASAPTKSTLRVGDVLIGCTAHEPHYVGNRVDYIDALPDKSTDPIVPVADVMVIRALAGANQIDPGFLASFLDTKWGRRQFQRLNRGLRGGHVYGDDVRDFIYVPIPSPEWMAGFQTRQQQIRTARRLSIETLAAAVGILEMALH